MSRERMNSSPEYVAGPGGYRPRLRRRTMSIENTSLTEVITIYEKLKKSRDHDPYSTDVFRPSSTTAFGFDIEESDFEESAPLEPFTVASGEGWPPSHNILGSQKVLDFNKYKHMTSDKYLYFSSPTGLLQSPNLEGLKFAPKMANDKFDGAPQELSYVKLLKSKQYWLNIIDPSEKDLALLASAFNVHDLTLRDIREGNTEEKIEVYKHYMFISLRLLSENDNSSLKNGGKRPRSTNATSPTDAHDESVFIGVEDEKDKESDRSSVCSSDEKDPMPFVEDVDFNILLFSDFSKFFHSSVSGFNEFLTTIYYCYLYSNHNP